MIAQKPPQLARYHRNTIGRKLHVLAEIKAVNGFDKPDTADLKQVVHALAASGKLLYDRQHEAQISVYELVARGHIARLRGGDQLAHLGVFQKRQL